MSFLEIVAGGAAGIIISDVIGGYFIGRKFLRDYGTPERAEEEIRARAAPDIEFFTRATRKLAYRIHYSP